MTHTDTGETERRTVATRPAEVTQLMPGNSWGAIVPKRSLSGWKRS